MTARTFRTIGRVVMVLALLLLPGAFAAHAKPVATDTEIRALADKVTHKPTKFKLIRIGRPAVVPLFDKLEDPNEAIGAHARSALRWIADLSKSNAARGKGMTEELAAIVKSKRSLTQRSFAVDLLGDVGGSHAARTLVPLLKSAKLRMTALGSLRRIPGKAVTEGMIAALEKADVDFRVALLRAIGGRPDPKILPVLVANANDRKADPRVTLAAVQAIGNSPDPEAAGKAIMAARVQKGKTREAWRAKAFAFVSIGNAYAARGNVEKAQGMYMFAIKWAPKDSGVIVAVLDGYGRVAQAAVGHRVRFRMEADTARWLKSDSEAIRTAAFRAYFHIADALMAANQSKQALLLYRHVLDSPRSRWFYLARAIYRCGLAGDPESVSRIAPYLSGAPKRLPHLNKLQRSELLQTAVRALGRIGGAKAEEHLQALLKKVKPESSTMDALMDAFVHLGHDYGRKGQPDKARTAYTVVVSAKRAYAATIPALAGLSANPSASSIPAVKARLADKHPPVRLAAARAATALGDFLAKRGDRQEAIDLYRGALGVFRGAEWSVVVDKLRGLKYRLPLFVPDGVVTCWWVAGPFPANTANAWEESYFPETKIDLRKEHKVAGRKIAWKTIRVGMNSAAKPPKKGKTTAYLYTDIIVRQPLDAIMQVDGPAEVLCWVNGRKVESGARVRLSKGANTILLKVRHAGGVGGVRVRLTDGKGNPLLFRIR